MSKGNLFLGMGRGKVGDVVFSRQNGVQVTRVRNRSPRNPQSPLQLLQRVVLKTNASAYSLMKDICDHSFQGFRTGTPNQSEFVRLNVDLMRQALADEINSGDAAVIMDSAKTNFSVRGQYSVPINAYLISDGSLQFTKAGIEKSGTGSSSSHWRPGLNMTPLFPSAEAPAESFTYQEIIDVLGVQRGDQLTFVSLTVDDTENAVESSVVSSFHYGRIILEPADGDMTKTFLVKDAETFELSINDPNPRNDFAGTIQWNTSSQYLNIILEGTTDESSHVNSIAACGVIVSRPAGDTWLRSRCVLTVRPSGNDQVPGHLKFDANTLTLGDAVRSFQTQASSLLYLNQAED